MDLADNCESTIGNQDRELRRGSGFTYLSEIARYRLLFVRKDLHSAIMTDMTRRNRLLGIVRCLLNEYRCSNLLLLDIPAKQDFIESEFLKILQIALRYAQHLNLFEAGYHAHSGLNSSLGRFEPRPLPVGQCPAKQATSERHN